LPFGLGVPSGPRATAADLFTPAFVPFFLMPSVGGSIAVEPSAVGAGVLELDSEALSLGEAAGRRSEVDDGFEGVASGFESKSLSGSNCRRSLGDS
jgi:hypothetical protein